MPPRYAYWTILAGGLPTAFRATEREELLPTFARIREKHPDAEMKYFARGKLWESREAAAADAAERKRTASSAGRGAPPRRRDWRPGGEHRDPRQRFKEAKQQRNQDRRRERFERRHGGAQPRQKPHGDPLRRQWRERPPRARRVQGTEEPAQPPRPPGPNREPKPGQVPEPSAPPRPSEPKIPPPGPPVRGRTGKPGRPWKGARPAKGSGRRR